jgi:hypothetical protein
MAKAIPVTRRELERAWRQLRLAADVTPRQAPHLLLVFYAVECGLKAVWLLRQAKPVLEGQDIDRLGHDLGELLKDLLPGRSVEPLPARLELKPLGKPPSERTRSGGIDVLHQAWRYGVELSNPPERVIAQQLDCVNRWIDGELR